MSKLKSPIIPLSASSPKLPISKNLIPSSNPISSYGKSQKADLLFGNEADSDATGSKSDSGKSQTQSPVFETSYVDPRLALFEKNVEAMRSNLKDGKATVGTKAQSSSIFLKPTDQKRIKDLLLFADGGKEGASSGDYRYNPKTDKIESLVEKEPVRPVVPTEHSDLAEIMSSKLGWFDFTGWDDLTPTQQRSHLLRAGLDSESMLKLLNAGTSLETIALIQDIDRNRVAYGLSRVEVQDISDQLFKIANERIGAKNHDMPFLTSPVITKIFLKTLDEKEQELIGPYINSKGTTDIPFTAKNAKEDNRIPLKKGKYIDYNVVDLTDDLYKFMRYSAQLVKYLKDTSEVRKTNFMDEFIQLVKTKGALDIKSQEPWMFRDGLTYLFNGEVMRNDDIGNIAFGYYGAAAYGKDFLHLGAGYYQLQSDLKHKYPVQWNGKFFDDPQDYDMIEYGYELYKEEHPD